MSKKLSRRDFARTSVAAGAAVAAVPGALLGKAVTGTTAAAAGAAVAKRVRVAMPPDLEYGGVTANGQSLMLADTLTPAGQTAPNYPNGWQEGTTIPQEYYVDDKNYPNDEQFMKDHFWWMIDHHSRIPNPGDYFTFQFGRGDSVIVVRDKDGEVKGFHNVCRHRGSRLCAHDELLPTGAGPGGARPHPNFSIIQLGGSGNTPVFRCPYHAWTYNTSGALIYLPPGGATPGFEQAEHGLHPVTLKVMGGFIFITFADNPPDFDTWVGNFPQACEEYRTADLKIAARRMVPNRCNWKLVIENFRECYHCGPSHGNSFITANWSSDGTLIPAQRAEIERQITLHGHPEWEAGGNNNTAYQRVRDRLVESGTSSMGTARRRRSHYRPGYVTATLDGKPAAPFLPGVEEYTHGMGTGRSRSARLGFSTTAISIYEDYVFCGHFTPRNVALTDVEAFWLVHPDAEESTDYDVEHLVGLWHETLLEDRWLGENNHHGILSSRYAYKGGQPYMAVEGGPAGFVKWYMGEVVPSEFPTQKTDAG